MVVTIVTKKKPYIFPDIDGFEVKTDGEGLNMVATMEDGEEVVKFGEWADV